MSKQPTKSTRRRQRARQATSVFVRLGRGFEASAEGWGVMALVLMASLGLVWRVLESVFL